jgi:hypothetical protein
MQELFRVLQVNPLGADDVLLLLVIRALLSDTFFGGRLRQRNEESGNQVPFAGSIVMELNGLVHTRISNPNVTYTYGQADEYTQATWRFRSGYEYQARRAVMGQLYGHLIRAVDHSNQLSIGWLPADWLALSREWLASGWSGR